MKIVMDKSLTLTRNVDGYKFLPKMSEEEKNELINKLEPIIFDIGYSKIDLENLSSIEKLQYVERGILSSKFLQFKSSRYYIFKNNPDIYLNDIDHIMIRSRGRDISLMEEYEKIKKIEKIFEKKVNFSFDFEFGYLSSNILNTGTCLRPEVIFHLPGLFYYGINKISKPLLRLGYSLEPYKVFRKKAVGSIYYLNFESTIGDSEENTINKIDTITKEISLMESESRKKLYLDNIINLEDIVNRSYGLLKNARILSEDEMIESLSNVNLGIELSILKPNKEIDLIEEINNLKNGHLQMERGSVLDTKSRDILRANKSRALMKEVF